MLKSRLSTLNALGADWHAASAVAMNLLPGVCVTFGLAAGVMAIAKLPFMFVISPLMIAIVLGIAVRLIAGNLERCRPGMQFVLKRMLRLAIVLLGLQLTLDQVTAVGGPVLIIVIATVIAAFAFTSWVGRCLSVDARLVSLIAAGTSICGISAIVTSNTVVGAPDEDVAYAVATATVFGSLSVFLFPLFAVSLELQPHPYAVWVGSSVHEIAQVIAAGFQYGHGAGEFSVVVKLTRVLMLAPMVLAMAWVGAEAARRVTGNSSGNRSLAEIGRSLPVPIFLLGFAGMILINSFDIVPPAEKAWILRASSFLFIAALVALGLETDLRKLKDKGLRPLMIGALSWVFISFFSLALVYLLINR